MDQMIHADDTQPATRGELNASTNMLRGELRATETLLQGNLKSLETRLEAKIEGVRHTLVMEIIKTQVDIREVKETMAGLSTKDDVQRILGAIDSFAGKAQNYDRAATLHGHSLTELDITVKDHEGRIKNLESGRS